MTERLSSTAQYKEASLRPKFFLLHAAVICDKLENTVPTIPMLLVFEARDDEIR